MSKGSLLIVAVAALVVALYLLGVLDDPAEAVAGVDAALEELESHGAWAWAAAIVLLCADLVFPVPAGPVIAALGLVYGVLVAGAIGATGLMAAGLLAYGLVRVLGRRVAVSMSSEDRLAGLERWFERVGPWAIVLTRGLPLVPEAVACLAGLARMRLATFLLALAIGSLPTGVAFAAIGVGLSDRPLVAMILSYLVPILLLPIALRLTRDAGTGSPEITSQ